MLLLLTIQCNLGELLENARYDGYVIQLLLHDSRCHYVNAYNSYLSQCLLSLEGDTVLLCHIIDVAEGLNFMPCCLSHSGKRNKMYSLGTTASKPTVLKNAKRNINVLFCQTCTISQVTRSHFSLLLNSLFVQLINPEFQ